MRFEYYENTVMKSRFSNCTWQQAAQYAIQQNLNKGNTSVSQVIQDGEKLVILKRKNKKHSFGFKMGFD